MKILKENSYEQQETQTQKHGKGLSKLVCK
jgi:hypothetical protein